jgi:transcriptional regulator
MYLPSQFEETRIDVLHQLVQRHPLGLLITHDGQDIEANAIPFLLDAGPAGRPGTLLAHVARANPVWKEARHDADSLVVFQGPQAYISPGWYPSKAVTGQEVPTWNYVMVQARGRLRVRDDPQWVLNLITRLSERHEAGRPMPWAVGDAPPDFIDKLLGAIVGIEIELASITGKWKVSQNKKAVDRAGVVHGLGQQPGDEAAAMARQVRQPGCPC